MRQAAEQAQAPLVGHLRAMPMPHLSVPGIIRETEEELRPVRHFILEMS